MDLVCYIDREYFNELDLITPSIFRNKDEETNAENIKLSIRASLMAASIKTTLTNKDCIEYFKRIQDVTKISTSWKEEIIYKAINEDRFQQVSKTNYDDSNAVYFVKETLSPNSYSNKIIITDFHNKKDYYDNLNQRYEIDDRMEDISVIKHEANSIVIVDPYVFKDTRGKAEKMPNIIKFLKQIFTTPNETYYLSFIGQNKNDNLNEIVELRFRTILEAFPENTIHISGFFPNVKIFDSNRFIFTNYCLCGYQHLFDRIAEIYPTCLFVHPTGSIKNRIEKIKVNYTAINFKLNAIKAVFDSEPEKFGLIKIKFGNVLSNPIFK